MAEPLVSIIIVNWNDAQWIEACLHSVEQCGWSNLEIIFVDNASTDDSVRLVQSRFPRVNLILNKENLGFARGNNIGIEASSGKYVALLNCDTTVAPGWVTSQVEACEADPKIGICGSKMRLMREPEKLNSVRMVLLPNGLTKHIGDGEIDRGQYDHPRTIFCVAGAGAFCRREMLDQIGLLDEDFFAYYEDLDLSWRAWLRGWKCMYVPTAVLYHYRNVTIDRNQSLYWHFRHLNQRNRIWVLLKNFSWGSLLQLSPSLLAYDLVMTGKGLKALLTRSRPPVELKARWDALQGLGRTLKKRRAIQQTRVTSEAEIRALAFDRSP